MSNFKEEMTQKTEEHYLENKWTFWMEQTEQNSAGGGKKNSSMSENEYEATLRPLHSFVTIEEFWCGFNSFEPIQKLSSTVTLILFRSEFKPMWEDENIKDG